MSDHERTEYSAFRAVRLASVILCGFPADAPPQEPALDEMIARALERVRRAKAAKDHHA